MTDRLRRRLAEHAPPRASLRTRVLAAGLGGGQHRAERRGSGIEFAGHREYSPGDDLRHLDRHALLRHGRHLIREFHSETERALWLLVDCSPSMDYRGEGQRETKLGFSLLLAAGLALLARAAGDPVGASPLGIDAPALPPRAGLPHFEHVLAELETLDVTHASGARSPGAPFVPPSRFVERLTHVGQRAPRGSTIVLFSDLLDDEPAWWRELPSLTASRRRLVVVQTLDRSELDFPFQGALRLRDPEGDAPIDTDAERARQGYLRALDEHTQRVAGELTSRGAAFLRLATDVPLPRAFTLLRAALTGGSGEGSARSAAEAAPGAPGAPRGGEG